jgi:hypothetical protein
MGTDRQTRHNTTRHDTNNRPLEREGKVVNLHGVRGWLCVGLVEHVVEPREELGQAEALLHPVVQQSHGLRQVVQLRVLDHGGEAESGKI